LVSVSLEKIKASLIGETVPEIDTDSSLFAEAINQAGRDPLHGMEKERLLHFQSLPKCRGSIHQHHSADVFAFPPNHYKHLTLTQVKTIYAHDLWLCRREAASAETTEV
jgi:hypothetical protein